MKPLTAAVWYFGFLLTGLLTTLLGPILPQLSAVWHLNDSQSGLLFVAQFLGSLIGALAGGAIAEQIGIKRVVAGGFLVCTLGIFAGAYLPWPLGAIGMGGWGLGLGLIIALVNLAIAGANPNRRASALNLLNFVWGLGAVASGPMVTITTRFGLTRLLTELALLFGAIFLGVAVCPIPTAARVTPEAKRPKNLTALIFWTGLFLFLYVGVENGIAGWLPTYVTRDLLSVPGAAWVQVGFWSALLAGRLAAPFTLHFASGRQLLTIGLTIASAGIAGIVGVHNLPAAILGALLVGLGLSAVFPTAIALFTERAGQVGTRVTGIVFSIGGLGGVVLPALVGLVSTTLASLRLALLATLLCTLAMISVLTLANPWRTSTSR